ncbi:hypothetical protein FOA52_013174 [Chlamydomonas sp. UWO 241]|nr:hypothetical protein FOA52_013174 [Chlamydomonas sp. UWO 241]
MATSMAKSTMSSRAVGISARAPTMRVNPTPARMVKVNFFSEEGTRDRLAGKKPTPESRREAVAMLDALIAQRTAETEIARAKYEAQGMKALDAARKAEHGSPDLSASRAEAVAMLDAMRNKTAAPAASSGGNNWNSYEGSSAATKKVTPTGDSKSRSEAIAALDAMMAERNAAAAKAREAYVKGEATKTAVKAAAPAAAAPAAGGNNWNSYEGSAKAAPKVAPSGNSASRAEAIAMLDNLRAQREAEAARAPAPAARAAAPAAPASSGGNNWNSYEGSSKAAPKVAPSGNSASRAEAIAMLDNLRAQREAEAARAPAPRVGAAPVPAGNSNSRAEAIAMLDALRAQREAGSPAPAQVRAWEAPKAAAPAPSSGGNNWNSYEGSSKAAPKVAPSGNSASRAEAIAMLDKLRAEREAAAARPAAAAPRPAAAASNGRVQPTGAAEARAEAIRMLDAMREKQTAGAQKSSSW